MKIKRIICVLLALLTLCGVFVSCSSLNDDEQGTRGPEVTYLDDDGKRYDENGFLMDDLPDDIDLEGKEIRILSHDTGLGENPTEMTGDMVSASVYKRNLEVEGRFGVKLVSEKIATTYDTQNDYVSKVHLSTDDSYDLLGSYSMCAMTLAIDGYLSNIGECDYVDFSKPWWPKTLVESCNINGNMYFATGDITITYYDQMFMTVMNKKLWEQYQFEDDIYEVVRTGYWTNEKMFKYAKSVYSDNNSNGKDYQDTFGCIISSSVSLDTFSSGANLDFIAVGSDGKFTVGADILSTDKGHSLIKLLNDNIWSTNNTFLDTDGQIQLREGRGLFTTTTVSSLGRQIAAGIEFPYAILPTPKYDLDQENYYTNLGFPYSMYSIPLACKDANVSALIMEAMASEGYRETTQVFYETKVKYRYSSDDAQNVEMFELISDYPYFDFSRFAYKTLEGGNMNPISTFRSCVQSNLGTWTSRTKSMKSKLEKFCSETLNAMFE